MSTLIKTTCCPSDLLCSFPFTYEQSSFTHLKHNYCLFSPCFCLSLGLREKCVDSLVFETLIPKPMMLHYISLLLKHRRLVLSGPSGTGKTYLAQRLAHHLLQRSRMDSSEADQETCVLGRSAAVTFNMHRQTQKVTPDFRFLKGSQFKLYTQKRYLPLFALTGVAVVSVQPSQSDWQRDGRRDAIGCYHRWHQWSSRHYWAC